MRIGPDPVTGVLRRRGDEDTRESHVKTQAKTASCKQGREKPASPTPIRQPAPGHRERWPPKQGRETSLADNDQMSSSRTEDTFLPSPPWACGPVTAAGPIRGRPHAVGEAVELNPSGPPASRATASHAAGSATPSSWCPGAPRALATTVGLQPPRVRAHLGPCFPRRIPGGRLHNTVTLTLTHASHSCHTCFWK